MIRPHAFVAMPFGQKKDSQGTLVDFNQVYGDLIVPALEAAGLSVFRADQEQRAGDIKLDMFQELLVADLVVADLTIDNPNVWYELGVRHALRARGVVLICGGQATSAFDLYTDRKIVYGLAGGALNPATLEGDRQSLTAMVKKTMASWQGRKISPVYSLMPNLQEPDWKSLRIGDVREFWEKYDAWERRIEVARQEGQIGDLLVVADEAPVAAFRAEAWIKAGKALREAGRFKFALEQLERGLAIEPLHLVGLQQKGICLQRLARMNVPEHSLARSRDHYRAVLQSYPKDPETWALLGRVDKDAWTAEWRKKDSTAAQMRADAADQDALLRAAIDSYAKGFRANQSHYYSGINALTLMHLFYDLTQDDRYEREAETMAGAVRYAAEGQAKDDFWAAATLGDLEVLVGTPETARRKYKDAIALNESRIFDLDACRSQLALLREVGFRPDGTTAGIETFDKAIARLTPPETAWQPKQVFLFSGHVIDAPNRPTPRFPAVKAESALAKIEAVLDARGAGQDDLAFCQAAAGGDLLFLEACQRRKLHCQILLPFPEPEFLEQSVRPADGPPWTDRYYVAKAGADTAIRIMPEALGTLPDGIDAFERCNLWLLYSALACGIDKVRFVCLWDGAGGDGPGGTAHMYEEVSRRTGRVDRIDVREL